MRTADALRTVCSGPFIERFQKLMGQPGVASDPEKFQRLAKEAASLASTVEAYSGYKDTQAAIKDTRELLKESSDDPEMVEMAQEELQELEAKIEVCTEQKPRPGCKRSRKSPERDGRPREWVT
jgi:protein subunit release factor A